MPELPEVETVARGLQRAVVGRRILTVTLGKTDFISCCCTFRPRKAKALKKETQRAHHSWYIWE
jgi:formamidopyrimidine-DNA glycosylase